MSTYRVTVTELTPITKKVFGRFAPTTELAEHDIIVIESTTKPSARAIAAVCEPEP